MTGVGSMTGHEPLVQATTSHDWLERTELLRWQGLHDYTNCKNALKTPPRGRSLRRGCRFLPNQNGQARERESSAGIVNHVYLACIKAGPQLAQWEIKLEHRRFALRGIELAGFGPCVPHLRYRAAEWLGSPYFNLHFYPRAKPIDDGHEAIHREPAEVGIADAGEVGRRNPGAGVRTTNAQRFPIKSLDDLGSQDRFELFHIRVSAPQSRRVNRVHGSFPSASQAHLEDRLANPARPPGLQGLGTWVEGKQGRSSDKTTRIRDNAQNWQRYELSCRILTLMSRTAHRSVETTFFLPVSWFSQYSGWLLKHFPNWCSLFCRGSVYWCSAVTAG